MKRRNVQLAFVGEAVTGDADVVVDELVDGDEAVAIEVIGGALTVVVPARTPDDQIFEAASTVTAELRLENGLSFSFEIQREAEGALFGVTPAGTRQEAHEGLSTIPNLPDP